MLLFFFEIFTNNQVGITWIFTDLTYTYTMSIFFSNLRPRCWDFEKEKRAQTRHMDTLPNKMRLVIGTWSAGYSWNVRTHQLWFNNLKTKWFKNIFIDINEIIMGKSSETEITLSHVSCTNVIRTRTHQLIHHIASYY